MNRLCPWFSKVPKARRHAATRTAKPIPDAFSAASPVTTAGYNSGVPTQAISAVHCRDVSRRTGNPTGWAFTCCRRNSNPGPILLQKRPPRKTPEYTMQLQAEAVRTRPNAPDRIVIEGKLGGDGGALAQRRPMTESAPAGNTAAALWFLVMNEERWPAAIFWCLLFNKQKSRICLNHVTRQGTPVNPSRIHPP